MPPSLPPLHCGHCGVCDVPTIGPGAGQHVARALCSNPACGRFLKWLPRALIAGKETAGMGGLTRRAWWSVAVCWRARLLAYDAPHRQPSPRPASPLAGPPCKARGSS